MRLRSFTGPDMPTVMKMVRNAMGDGAVILATETQKGRKGVTVTAAIETNEDPIPDMPRPAPRPTAAADAGETETLRFDLQTVLRFHNLPELFISKILNKTSGQELNSISALHKISAKRDGKTLLQMALERV